MLRTRRCTQAVAGVDARELAVTLRRDPMDRKTAAEHGSAAQAGLF
jgi:hypothetical protein